MFFKFEFSTCSHSHIVKKNGLTQVSKGLSLSLSLTHTHTHTHMAVLENMKSIPIYWNFMIFDLEVDFT